LVLDERETSLLFVIFPHIAENKTIDGCKNMINITAYSKQTLQMLDIVKCLLPDEWEMAENKHSNGRGIPRC